VRFIFCTVADDVCYGADEFGMSDVSVEEGNLDGLDSRNIFSDPESEWNSPESFRKVSTENINNMKEAFSLSPNSLPESDQRTNDEPSNLPLQRKPSYVIMSNIV
jgi:hypothetical protein